MENPVIVRFAPSPTGYLHIGGARTAIFNWLYARKTGGKFILRIEDTDAERTTEESIAGIVNGLAWLGLDWDEGPYFQSRFIKDHQFAAQKLLDNGKAYKCFCTVEELEKKRETARQNNHSWLYDGFCRNLSRIEIAQKEAAGTPYAIRLKVPRDEENIGFDDVAYGRVEKKTADLEDFVILRSNGQPLYVLSNAVDDIRDGVTHIIRGQDGLANTPKQLLIYRALEAPLPVFAHMSLALDPKKRKISKRRHGESVAIDFYRRNGFLPWAMVNFLVLYGWSRPGDQEIYSRAELIEAFSLEGITRHNPVIDLRQNDPKFITDPKTYSINAHYIKTMPLTEIADLVKLQLQQADIWDAVFDTERHQQYLTSVDLIRSRFHLLSEFVTLGKAYFSDDYPIDPKALQKNLLNHGLLKEMLPRLGNEIAAMPTYDKGQLEQTLKEFVDRNDIKAGLLINAVRTAVTGQPVGPEFLDVLLVLGQETVVRRLRSAPELWE